MIERVKKKLIKRTSKQTKWHTNKLTVSSDMYQHERAGHDMNNVCQEVDFWENVPTLFEQ